MSKLCGIFIVCLVLGVSGCTALFKPESKKPVSEQQVVAAPQPKTAAVPKEEKIGPTVSVRATIVQADADILYATGVSPFGEKGKAVTPQVLEKLIASGDGEITGQAVVINAIESSMAKSKRIFYIKKVKTVVQAYSPNPITTEDIILEPHDTGIDFHSNLMLLNNKIVVEFACEQHGVFEDKDDPDLPLEGLKNEWKGTIIVKDGVPMIAGATQHGDKVSYLVITAEVMK